MKENEFIYWLKGFVQGCNPYQASPKQWEELQDKLKEVDNNSYLLTFDEKNCSKTWI